MKLPQFTPIQRIVLLVALVGIAGAGIAVVRQGLVVSQPQPMYQALNARVVWSDEVFRIVNLENRSWLHCEFLLNKKYSFFREKVQAREVLQIAHTLFEGRTTGAPYRYNAEPPTSFSIRCEKVDGKIGLFSGTYAADAAPTE